MEKVHYIVLKTIQNLNENFYMVIKEKEKNLLIEDWNLKENIFLENGMEKDMMKMGK